MEKKLIFFDIDGTLIDCHTNLVKMSQKTRYSLETLKKAGHQIFIASGRCLCFMPPEIQEYPFDGYISCNGASIHYHGKAIYKDTISLTQIKRLETFAKENQVIYFLEEDQKIYTNKIDDPTCLAFAKKWQMPLSHLYPLTNAEALDVQMAMMICPNSQTLDAAKVYFQDDFDVQVHPGQLSTDLSLKTSSKGRGIRILTDYLDQNMTDTIAFGDGPNDMEMFNTVYLPIAMGNAVDELKERAEDITLTVAEDGIYHALFKHQLIKEI
ncbi:Cof-type HAD-IIB family hydrolase [Beduini massiliensis]|uniref:Cof-type HAD-IIB family hydrolase n=1 Tax=Beduini massiliensis TaxID=1585974 RepID=UPI00059AB02E|nr:HAD family hydrolase [Beduini massiliensis]